MKQIGFPDRTSPTGLLINAYLTQKETKLSDEAIHLLFSANRWEKADEIKKDLDEGFTIVCDRYAFSGIAFSVIKGLSWEWCKSPDVGLPRPDLTVFLSLNPDQARRRSGFGTERYETNEIQERVRAVFDKMGRTEFNPTRRGREEEDEKQKEELREEPDRGEQSGRRGGIWKEIDAEGSIEQVEAKVWSEVEKVWQTDLGDLDQPVGKLWVD